MFTRQSPTPAELPELAAKDYRAAAARCDELQRDIAALRTKPPALKDCIAIMERHAAARRAEFEAVIDERLASLADPHFDEKESALLDLTRFLAPGELGGFPYDESMWGLMSDRLLQIAETRLKALGFGKGPSIEEKRKMLEALQREHEDTARARDESLSLWRKLTGKPGGFPS
jgi:chromosome segregation ATPase